MKSPTSFLLVAWLCIWVGCNQAPPEPEKSSTTPTSVSATDSKYASLKTDYRPLSMDDSLRQKRIAQLAVTFVRTKDSFNNTTTYRDKTFSKYTDGDGTTIVADFVTSDSSTSSDPSLYLGLRYVGREWIFFKSCVVMVGNRQVYASSDLGKHEVGNGHVIESMLLSGPDALAVADIIARAGSEPVKVRLRGEYIEDFTLRPAHQKAIAKTLELWHLMGGSWEDFWTFSTDTRQK